MSGPLLAITTTRERAKPLAAIVFDRGCEPVLLPCIEVAPAPYETLEEARARAERADWLLITSPRAVAALWPEGGLPDTRVAAVGRSSATAVEAAGGSVAVLGEEGAEFLVGRLGAGLSGRTVFFPHSASADLSTLGAVRDLGGNVDSIAVYETRSIPPGPEPVDAALFGSPSAVEGWGLSRTFADVTLAAIGPTTTDALTARGHRPSVVAPRPHYEDLIDVVVRHLSERSPL